jgi:long-chain acyl-CoA synthetase
MDSMSSPSLRDTLESLVTRYDAAKVDRETIYYLSLGDSPDQKWTVTLTPTSCSFAPGRVGDAHCVLKTSSELFLKLIDGAYQPGALDFMTGKLKTNDIGLLIRLREAFPTRH